MDFHGLTKEYNILSCYVYTGLITVLYAISSAVVTHAMGD